MKDCEIFQINKIRNLWTKERFVLCFWKIWQSFVGKEWIFDSLSLSEGLPDLLRFFSCFDTSGCCLFSNGVDGFRSFFTSSSIWSGMRGRFSPLLTCRCCFHFKFISLNRASKDFFSASYISICNSCPSNFLWMKSISNVWAWFLSCKELMVFAWSSSLIFCVTITLLRLVIVFSSFMFCKQSDFSASLNFYTSFFHASLMQKEVSVKIEFNFGSNSFVNFSMIEYLNSCAFVWHFSAEEVNFVHIFTWFSKTVPRDST